MKTKTEKVLFFALFTVAAMNLVALLAKSGTAQTPTAAVAGTYQAACSGSEYGQHCVVIDTRTGIQATHFAMPEN